MKLISLISDILRAYMNLYNNRIFILLSYIRKTIEIIV